MNQVSQQRREILESLGGICVRCGFSDSRALQIDHVNGGGRRETAKLGQGGVLRRVLSAPEDYQLLCANCNWIKRYENDETRGWAANQRKHTKKREGNSTELVKSILLNGPLPLKVVVTAVSRASGCSQATAYSKLKFLADKQIVSVLRTGAAHGEKVVNIVN